MSSSDAVLRWEHLLQEQLGGTVETIRQKVDAHGDVAWNVAPRAPHDRYTYENFDDRAGGWRLQLEFWDGRFTGRTDPVGIRPPRPRTPLAITLGEQIRRALYHAAGPVGWAALAGVLVCASARSYPVRAWRPALAEAAMAAAVIGVLTANLDPRGTPKWTRFSYGSMLQFMALAAALLYGVPRPPPRDDTQRCDGCGYNLTGNLSGTCPECGTPVASSPSGSSSS